MPYMNFDPDSSSMLNIIQQIIPLQIKDNYQHAQNIVFVQDSAPQDTSKQSQSELSDNLNFWPKEMLLLNGPNLNPFDYSAWAYVKTWVCNEQQLNQDFLTCLTKSALNKLY